MITLMDVVHLSVAIHLPSQASIYLCVKVRRHFGSWGAGNDAGGHVVIDSGMGYAGPTAQLPYAGKTTIGVEGG